MPPRTAAVVGAAGGVGATRLTVELGATLARAGHDVALLDAAHATQGLARHVAGRIDPDLTALLVDDRPLADGLHDHAATDAVDGRLAVCPAHAPFTRVAAAAADAPARALGDRLTAAVEDGADAGAGDAGFDYALVDTPPVATNPAIAAVHDADRIAVVTAPTERGVDALQRTRGRLSDLDRSCDLVVGNRVVEEPELADADVAVPDASLPPAAERPAVLTEGSPLGPPVAAAAEALFECDLGLSVEQGLLDTARQRLG